MKTGRIYKIINSDDDKVYVGYTKVNISLRFERHLQDHAMPDKQTIPLYTHMNLLGADKFSIQLIEECPYETDADLLKREGYWQKELKTWVKLGGLNNNISTRTPKEWYQDTIEERKAYTKKADKEKAERLKTDPEYRKKYNERHKEYQRRPEVKERVKENLKNQKHNKEIEICQCGGNSGTNRYQHFMTNQHMNWLENEVRQEMRNRFMMEMNDVKYF